MFSMRYERIIYIIQDTFIVNVEAAGYAVLVQKGRSGGLGGGGADAAAPDSKLDGKMNILNKKVLIFCLNGF